MCTIIKTIAVCRLKAPLSVYVPWLLSVLLLLSTQLPLTNTADSLSYAAQQQQHSPHLPHHNIRHQHYESHGDSTSDNLATLPNTPTHQHQRQHQYQQHHQQHAHAHQHLQQQQLQLQQRRQHQKHQQQQQQHLHQPHHRPINATHTFMTTTSQPPTTTTTTTTATATIIKTTTTSTTAIRTATQAAGSTLTKVSTTSKPMAAKTAHTELHKSQKNYYQQQQQQKWQKVPATLHGQHNHKLQPLSPAHLRTAKPIIAPSHSSHGSDSSKAHAHKHLPPQQQQQQPFAATQLPHFKAVAAQLVPLSVAHNALSAFKHKSHIDQYEDAAAALDAAVSAGDFDDSDYYDYIDDEAYGAHDDDKDDAHVAIGERAATSYQHIDDEEDDDDDDGDDEDDWSQRAEWRTRVTRDHHRFEPPQHNGLAYDASANDQDYQNDETYEPGKLTQQKQEELGTPEAVQRSFTQEQERSSQERAVRLALDHRFRMTKAAMCSRPLPRIYHVSNDTSKIYLPHCTILHRCGEDTGCCASMGQVCTAKSYEDVKLYFFVAQVNSKRFHTEVLSLRNDTECHCVDRANLTETPEFNSRGKRSGHALRRHHAAQRALPNMPATDYSNRVVHDDNDNKNDNENVCRCPRYFDVVEEDNAGHLVRRRHTPRARNTHNSNCRCECLNPSTPCQRLKTGVEGFAIDDRRCISEGLCSTPTCSYGEYSHTYGRCPHRHDGGFG